MSRYIAGVDEVGRGPLAGNVVAAAVIFEENKIDINDLKDSKKLSEKKREKIYQEIISKSLSYAIGFATPEEIDQINILQATLLAMRRAIENLKIKPTEILIDGIHIPRGLTIPARAIIQGDNIEPVISAASILAKVTRDREMHEAHLKYPRYNFAKHKGYGTREHLDAINNYGICELHRKSFAPIKYIR